MWAVLLKWIIRAIHPLSACSPDGLSLISSLLRLLCLLFKMVSNRHFFSYAIHFFPSVFSPKQQPLFECRTTELFHFIHAWRMKMSIYNRLFICSLELCKIGFLGDCIISRRPFQPPGRNEGKRTNAHDSPIKTRPYQPINAFCEQHCIFIG